MTATQQPITVVLPTYNRAKELPSSVASVLNQTWQNIELIVVDDASTDDTLAFVSHHYPQVRIHTFETNRGFSVAVNAGIQLSRGEYVVLLNTDTYPQPDWMAALVEVMDNSPPEVGCLASKMLNMESPGIIDDAGDLLSWYGSAKKRGHGCPADKFTQVDEVFSPCGGAALYRRSLLNEVSGYDERFVAYLEDVDVGLRGRLLGYRCLFVPAAEILHHGYGAA